MSYKKSLEAAGAEVLAFEMFGSYQGDWAAFCEVNGEKVIIKGSYGSCSGCDAFEAEFSWGEEPEERDGKYYYNYDEVPKEEYDIKLAEYTKKLADFGQYYLNNPCTKETIEANIANLESEDWFSDEEKEVLEWCLKQFQ